MLTGSELVAVCIGSVGSALMFVAYCLVNFQQEMGKYAIGERSLIYLTMNFVGGALASASAFVTGSPGAFPVGVLEGLWGLVGLIGLLRAAIRWVRRTEAGKPPTGVCAASLPADASVAGLST